MPIHTASRGITWGLCERISLQVRQAAGTQPRSAPRWLSRADPWDGRDRLSFRMRSVAAQMYQGDSGPGQAADSDAASAHRMSELW